MTPTMDDVLELQKTLQKMDKKTFDVYKQLAFILTANKSAASDDSDVITKQKQFIQETAGKLEVDEDAINDLRMRSTI